MAEQLSERCSQNDSHLGGVLDQAMYVLWVVFRTLPIKPTVFRSHLLDLMYGKTTHNNCPLALQSGKQLTPQEGYKSNGRFDFSFSRRISCSFSFNIYINFSDHSFLILSEVSHQVVKSVGLRSILTFMFCHGACQLKSRLKYNNKDPNSWARHVCARLARF